MGWLFLWVMLSSVLAESPETISFNEHIRPLLAEHCLHCHGPDASQRKGDLRLDLEAAARSRAILAGNPQASPLMSVRSRSTCSSSMGKELRIDNF